MSAPSIVVLTGAGISQESGLSTFRDPDGIWARHRVEDVATPEAFARDPARVHEFYNLRRRNLLAGHVQPNTAHRALATCMARCARCAARLAAMCGRSRAICRSKADVHLARAPAACAPTWCGSARCRLRWNA